MSLTRTQAADPAAHASLDFLQRLLANYPSRDFAVRCWDGTTWPAAATQPTRCTVVLQHPGAIRRMFWPPSRLTLCEAYIYDDFDVEGDMESFWAFGRYLNELRLPLRERLRLGARLFRLPNQKRSRTGRQAARLTGARHSLERDRQAVAYHYDVSNDFFALFLDRRMVYTCAYFADSDEDLDTAQERKLEHVCRKLRLRPGERLLDIGCGWGGLLIYAAQRYGVEAVGITLSTGQAELANQRIHAAGLADRCRVELRDYREVKDPNGFDKIASIEMFEQVGEEMLPAYFQQAWELLRPGGVFLNQGISVSPFQPPLPRASFGNRYVFPDGALVTLSTTLDVAERAGFDVRDVESLREHYVLTLRHWIRRLEAQARQARQLTDDVTYRIWRLYMSIAAFGFKIGRLSDYQVLLCRPHPAGDSGLPLNRVD